MQSRYFAAVKDQDDIEPEDTEPEWYSIRMIQNKGVYSDGSEIYIKTVL